MTDKEFQRILTATFNAKQKFFEFLEKAEEEYTRRFGEGTIENDDFWIDTMQLKNEIPPYLSEITEAALSAKEL